MCAAAALSSLSLPHGARARRTAASGVPPHVARLPAPPRTAPTWRAGPPPLGVVTRHLRAAKARTPVGPARGQIRHTGVGLIQVRLVGGRMRPPPPTCDVEVVWPFFFSSCRSTAGWPHVVGFWLLVGPGPRHVNGQRHGTDPLLLLLLLPRARTRHATLRPAAGAPA